MKKLAATCLRLIESALGLTLLFLTLMVFLNVVLRYGFNSGIDISEELSRILFVWLTFVASAQTCLEGGHVAFTALVARLPRWANRIAKTIVAIGIVYCCCLLVQSSYGHAVLNMGNILPVSGIPTSWFFYAGIAGGSGMLVATVYNLIKLYRNDEETQTEDKE